MQQQVMVGGNMHSCSWHADNLVHMDSKATHVELWTMQRMLYCSWKPLRLTPAAYSHGSQAQILVVASNHAPLAPAAGRTLPVTGIMSLQCKHLQWLRLVPVTAGFATCHIQQVQRWAGIMCPV